MVFWLGWHWPTFPLRVSSAQRVLTAVFGMGTGVSLSVKAPNLKAEKIFSVSQIKCFWLLFTLTPTLSRQGRGRMREFVFRMCLESLFCVETRFISTALLKLLLALDMQPINLVISKVSQMKSNLEDGFTLICFQRLSVPNVATQRCLWQDNWYTRDSSFPDLSY